MDLNFGPAKSGAEGVNANTITMHPLVGLRFVFTIYAYTITMHPLVGLSLVFTIYARC